MQPIDFRGKHGLPFVVLLDILLQILNFSGVGGLVILIDSFYVLDEIMEIGDVVFQLFVLAAELEIYFMEIFIVEDELVDFLLEENALVLELLDLDGALGWLELKHLLLLLFLSLIFLEPGSFHLFQLLPLKLALRKLLLKSLYFLLQLSNKRFLLDDNINFILQLLTHIISFGLQKLVVTVEFL